MINFMLKPIEHEGQRVVTTTQLAEAYGTTERRISENFNRNRERFIEGKHFYCLTGEMLKEFRANTQFAYLPSNINTLYLWTERGTLLHAKSLNTDKAWEVHDFLTDHYFRVQELKVSHYDMILKMYQKQNELESRLNQLESKLSENTFRLPEKSSLQTRQENAAYVMEKLEQDGGTVFTKGRILRLCRKLKAKSITKALKMLEENGYISYRKIRSDKRGKPKEIIIILKPD